MFEAGDNIQYFETQGDSMWPLLRAGDRIIARYIRPAWLRSSDIVVYRNTDKIICHRLIKCKKEGSGFVLYCRADTAFRFGLEQISEEKYLGKVIGFVRGEKIYSLEKSIFSWHVVNRVVAPVCVVLVRIKLLLRMNGIRP